MIESPTLPGLYYQQVPRVAEPSPLRTDVAGFIGGTRRGPVGVPVRVEGFQEFATIFGGLDRNEVATYAIRGYFENEGQVAHIVRVCADDPRCAVADWVIDERIENGLDTVGCKPAFPTAGCFRSAKYRIIATSPGTWAAGLRVKIQYNLNGPVGIPIVSMTVQCEGEPTEYIRQLVPGETEPGKRLEDLVAKQSRLIRIEAIDPKDRLTDANGKPLKDDGVHTLAVSPGPQSIPWDLTLRLPKSIEVPTQESSFQQYQIAIERLTDQTEVAIIATPSIYFDIKDSGRRQQVFQLMIASAVETQDRLVLIDAPRQNSDDSQTIVNEELGSFVNELRLRNPDRISQRVVAVYHPWLRVIDPLADATNPLRTVPPSGHVAGVMSRVDRERGSHHTPANVMVHDTVDVETLLDRNAGGPLIASGINLVRCVQGKGLMIWGGRTLDLSRDGRFIAHRRFIHRLIRAIGRVANPVVFDTNGPELWLILVRAVTTVLLEAFRGGALQGARPEEAFRVRCNDQTSSLSEREQGRVLCEIDLALAAPMEFITIRVSVSREGRVEVFDA